jgi:hypothetical protein
MKVNFKTHLILTPKLIGSRFTRPPEADKPLAAPEATRVQGSMFRGYNRLKLQTTLIKICNNQHTPLGESVFKPE